MESLLTPPSLSQNSSPGTWLGGALYDLGELLAIVPSAHPPQYSDDQLYCFFCLENECGLLVNKASGDLRDEALGSSLQFYI